MKKKLFLVIIAILMTMLLVAGCDNDGDASGSEDVTLRFSWWGGDARHEATLEVLDLYTYLNPHITFEPEFGGFDGYHLRISTQLAGGTEPDLMQLDQPWLPDFWPQSNFFIDFNEYSQYIDLSGFDRDFLEEFGYYENRLVALPTGLNSLSFLVNMRVLNEAGVNFGDTITWDDLINEGRKVNEHNPNNFMINMGSGTQFFVTRIFLYQLTGRFLVDEDFSIAFTRDQLLEAYNFTMRMYEENVMVPLEEALLFDGGPQDNPGWNTDRFGGWFNWASTAILQEWGDYAAALPYPIMPNAQQSAIIVRPAQVMSVSINTDYSETAVQFLDFFFNNEDAAILLTDTRAIPPVASNRDLLSEMGLINQIVVDSVNFAIDNIGLAENELSTRAEIAAVFDVVFQRMVLGQITPEEAVEETFTLLENVLEDFRAEAG